MQSWLATNANWAVPLLVLAGGAGGYLIDRIITRKSRSEDARSLIETVELKRRLDEAGMTIHGARELRDAIHRGSLSSNTRLIGIINEDPAPLGSHVSDDAQYPQFGDTTMGMIEGLSAKLKQIDADIDLVLAELIYQSSPARAEAWRNSQRAWLGFRQKEAEAAGLLFEGGSGAPVLRVSRLVDLAEVRFADLRQALSERESL